MVLLLALPSAEVMARRTLVMAWLRLLLEFMAVEAVARLRPPSRSTARTVPMSSTGRHTRPAGAAAGQSGQG
jgi:hypothetical protein